MLGITGTYRLAGNALRDLVLLLVCVVILIVCTNYTWSKGHPASTISRGMGLFLCVLAVAFTVWMLPYFNGEKTVSFSAVLIRILFRQLCLHLWDLHWQVLAVFFL